MQLQGKAALVTGSSSGIGQAIALAFAQEGADVVVHYNRDKTSAVAVVQQIQKLGRKSAAFGADVAEVAAVKTLIDQAVQTLGKLDILVSSAGLEIREPFLEVTEEHY